jgi:AcrR family transcriptional regulator
MTDVAARLGLNHALLYRYVESKQALLELAARYAMDPAAEFAAEVPLATPAPGRIAEMLGRWFEMHGSFPTLRTALEQGSGDDPRAELAAIIDEFYGFVQANRLLLSLVASLAVDYPELNPVAVVDRKRSHIVRLASFLSTRARSGHLRPLSDPEIAAHFIVESVGWFAWLRKADPSTALIDDERARSAVRELLLATFVPDATRTGERP